MTRIPTHRQMKLADAIADMASRIAKSNYCAGMAFRNGRGETNGKTCEQWKRAASRQLAALFRLTLALSKEG